MKSSGPATCLLTTSTTLLQSAQPPVTTEQSITKCDVNKRYLNTGNEGSFYKQPLTALSVEYAKQTLYVNHRMTTTKTKKGTT